MSAEELEQTPMAELFLGVLEFSFQAGGRLHRQLVSHKYYRNMQLQNHSVGG